ncbi:DNase1 protein [Pochonia chlamydosporia 170]|uniref:DNase1 protein n=1 Tax=Pochonia chlamydosporia 170 TaxID=1380566 RepID=A0A179EW57_METCM|nr:DNase1 protein [Pochonia chlamydosporia 170]OAQ57240.1 DNase1 protein [Pochonia chlamydosporia 170]
MHFATSALAFVASGAAASAASVTFWTLDHATRTVYFTPSFGSSKLDSVVVSNAEKKVVHFPDNWTGNFYAVQEGQNNVPGMLGEVNFNAWNGLTYFDVSAIVNPSDHNNVKQMWPASAESPMSGCEVFPCNNAYYLPNDVQTKATKETHIITSLGSGSTGLKFAEAH